MSKKIQRFYQIRIECIHFSQGKPSIVVVVVAKNFVQVQLNGSVFQNLIITLSHDPKSSSSADPHMYTNFSS